MANERGTLFQGNRRFLLNKNHCCEKCGRRIGLEVHHIKPLAFGGTDDLENLIVLCDVCHSDAHKLSHGRETQIGVNATQIADIPQPLFSRVDLDFALMTCGYEVHTAHELIDLIDRLPVRWTENLSKIRRAALSFAYRGKDVPDWLMELYEEGL